MRTKSLLAVGRPLPSGMRSSNLWSLIMAIFYDANVNPPRPASGHEYKNTMPWLNDETQFGCEGCGDLVTLEKAKLRGQPAAIVNSWSKSNADLTAQAKAFDRMSIFKCAALAAPAHPSKRAILIQIISETTRNGTLHIRNEGGSTWHRSQNHSVLGVVLG
jgi:hypothetical protein